VIKNAYVLFLFQAFHRWPGEFLPAFIRVLTVFSKEISRPLPLDDLKSDLTEPGYPVQDLEKQISILHAIEDEHQER
jgi:hypothetical protein